MEPDEKTEALRILVLEDDRAHQELVLRGFNDDPGRFRVSVAGTIKKARELLSSGLPDLIIADWILPDGKGIDILPRENGMVACPLVIMTSFGDENLAVEIMKSGAIDYVVKSGTVFKELPAIARRAIREWKNIHGRMVAEESARASEKRLADVINFLPDAVLAIDSTGKVIAWNHAMEKLSGVPASEMLGKDNYEYSIPMYGERRPILIDLVLAANPEAEQAYPSLSRDSDTITAESFARQLHNGSGGYLWGTASPLYDDAANRIGAIEVVRDITDKKKIEEYLIRRENVLTALLNAPHDSIILLHRDGTILNINEVGAGRLGGTVQDIIGKNAFDLLPPDVAQKRRAFVNEVVASGKPLRFEDERGGVFLSNAIYPVFNPDHTAVDQVAVFAQDITERKRSEEKTHQLLSSVQSEKEKLVSLVDSIPDEVWYIDVNRNFTLLNPQAIREFGLENITESDADRLLAGLEVLRPDGTPRPHEEAPTFRAQNGEVVRDALEIVKTPFHKELRYRQVTAAPVRDASGSITGVVSVVRDITDMKKAEAKVSESESRFRDLFNYMSAGVVIYEPVNEGSDFIIKDFNHGAEIIEKVKREDVIRKSVLEVFPGVRDLGLFSVFQRVAQTGIPESLPVGWYKDNRISGWRENFIYRLPSGEVVALYNDVTEKKQAEAEIEESNERFRIVARATNDTIWDWNIVSHSLWWSEGLQSAFGYPVEATRTTIEWWEERIHPDDRERVSTGIYAAIEAGKETWSDEYRFCKADGSYAFVLDRGSIMRDSSGRTTRMVGALLDLTERKTAENRIRESEERFRTVADYTYDWEYWTLPDGTYQYISPSCERITGYSPKEFYADKDFLQKIIHPDDRLKLSSHTDYGIVEESAEGSIEFRIIKKDGSTIWIGHICREIHNAHGEPIGRRGSNRDITQRKAAEDALKLSEARFRALFQNSSDIIMVLDQSGSVVYESPSAERILGYRTEKMTRQDILDHVYPEDRERVATEFGAVFANRKPGTPTEYRVRTAGGGYLWVDSIGINLLDVPKVHGVVLTTRPIQQRKEAEAALHESEERLRLALEGADVGFWDWDLTTGKAVFSDRFYTMLDYEPGEFPASYEAWVSLMHPDDRQRVLPDLERQIREKREHCEIEYRCLSKQGTWFWLLGRGKIVAYDDKGNPARMTGVNIDISNRRLMESEIKALNTVLEQRVKDRTEALSQANEALEEENAQRLEAEKKLTASVNEKSMLLKEIHHRVKNNLQIIASLLNLQSRYIKDEQTLSAIRESQNRVKAMALVHEKLYRSEDIAHISLEDYIKFLGSGLFQFYDAKSRGIRFLPDIHNVEVDINTAIPLGLIINELISNSLKYAFPEGRHGEVSVSVRQDGNDLSVIYSDTGIGIPQDLDWKNTASLGLRLVNTLVDQMDGTIELDRSSGTRFTMAIRRKG